MKLKKQYFCAKFDVWPELASVEQLSGFHSGRLLTLPTNIRSDCKGLVETNALVYLLGASVMKKKVFVRLVLAVNVTFFSSSLMQLANKFTKFTI